jgi:AcrR family transcriptional regulator
VTTVRKVGRPRSEHVEGAVLDAAIDELAERGYQGLSIEAVASRAGVAKTTLYRRWAGKDELVMDALGSLKGSIAELPGCDVRSDLVLALEHMRLNWRDARHGAVMRRLAAEAADQPELYAAYRQRFIRPRQLVVLRVLRRAVAEGLIDPDVDLERVRDLLVAPVIAAGMTLREAPSRADVEFVVDTVLGGLRRSAPR